MSIFIPSIPGCRLILTLTEKYDLFPMDNDTRKQRSFKVVVRLIVSLITLRFFLHMGFYFNLICGCIKGCLSIACQKDRKTIGDYNTTQFQEDTKRHFATMVVDLAALTFKNYYYFLFALYPVQLSANLEKLKNIIHEEFTLDVGEDPIEILDNSSAQTSTKRPFCQNNF